MRAFVAELKQLAKGAFTVHFDDKDVQPGGNIDHFMKRISAADAVVVLMTPAYKRKVVGREKSVYTEFSAIWSRYQKYEATRREGINLSNMSGYFDIIPILWSGEKNNAVVDDIKHLRYLDFTSFRPPVQRRASTHKDLITRIVDTVRTVIELKRKSFREAYFLYRNLFTDVKAGGRGATYERLADIFVKTDAYKRVEKQEACFLIGRKGSGKSSVVQGLWLLRGSAYRAHIEIVADDFNFGAIYNLMTTAQIRSDVTDIFRRVECYRYAWEAFMYLAAIATFVDENPSRARDNQLLKRRLRTLVAAGRSVKLHSREALPVYFVHAFDSIPAYISECIKNARPDERHFRSDLQARFSRRQFLEFVIGEKELRVFDDLLRSHSRDRIFVTLDGFDTAFGLFRRTTTLHPTTTAPLGERAAFEIELLASFLMEVNRMRRTRQDESLFHSILDFCITVPRDLFLDVPKVDRDSYRYISGYCALNWTGIELAILLRKRLELLAPGADTKKAENQEGRLQNVWRRACPRVPWQIRIPFGSAYHDMPLFMYVLRHTFWRPRDILLHYAKIVALGREGKSPDVSSDQIRRVVRDTTYEIITREFIDEFEHTIPNLRDVLERFRSKKQFLRYAEVVAAVDGIDFGSVVDDVVSRDDATVEAKLLRKLKLLYDIGVLGIELTAELQQQFHILHRQAFYFNEGNTLFKGGKLRDALKHCRFIVHPIFTEYLEIDNGGESLTLQFSWKYLHDVEDVIRASSGQSLF